MPIHYDAGRYNATITGQHIGNSSNGTPQIIIEFTVDSHASGAACENYERRVYRSLTENTREYVEKDLEALGFRGLPISALSPASDQFHDLRGTQIRVMCKHETYQGDDKERWSLVFSNSGPLTEKPLDAAGLRRLDALFGKCVPAGRPAPVKPVVEAPMQADAQFAPPPGDDDVPF
jgi:hypothetical protein